MRWVGRHTFETRDRRKILLAISSGVTEGTFWEARGAISDIEVLKEDGIESRDRGRDRDWRRNRDRSRDGSMVGDIDIGGRGKRRKAILRQ